jgi:hypothetical protein
VKVLQDDLAHLRVLHDTPPHPLSVVDCDGHAARVERVHARHVGIWYVAEVEPAIPNGEGDAVLFSGDLGLFQCLDNGFGPGDALPDRSELHPILRIFATGRRVKPLLQFLQSPGQFGITAEVPGIAALKDPGAAVHCSSAARLIRASSR